jgi:hypothetical protein
MNNHNLNNDYKTDNFNSIKNSLCDADIINSNSKENISTDLKTQMNTSKLIKVNDLIVENDTEIAKATDKNKNYYKMIFCYFIFLLLGFLGGIFINLISQFKMINFDMLFNIIISPILYYHSPRNILMNLDRNNLFKYYFIPFIIGLMFRFFGKIPGFSQFILDPYYIKSTLQISLLITVLTIIISLSIYYIYISSNPLVNTILFFCELVLTVISCYFHLLNNGYIHIHHYFIGLIIMLVSKNYHSKIVVIAHAISYAIYIEGISAYGFDSIFYK